MSKDFPIKARSVFSNRMISSIVTDICSRILRIRLSARTLPQDVRPHQPRSQPQNLNRELHLHSGVRAPAFKLRYSQNVNLGHPTQSARLQWPRPSLAGTGSRPYPKQFWLSRKKFYWVGASCYLLDLPCVYMQGWGSRRPFRQGTLPLLRAQLTLWDGHGTGSKSNHDS